MTGGEITMELNYNQVQEKLNELNKVVYAFEEAMKAIKNINGRYSSKNVEYLDIPIAILREETTQLNSKIDHLKQNAIVSYSYDTSEIDKLLVTKEEV
jgi:hypothetical protein